MLLLMAISFKAELHSGKPQNFGSFENHVCSELISAFYHQHPYAQMSNAPYFFHQDQYLAEFSPNSKYSKFQILFECTHTHTGSFTVNSMIKNIYFTFETKCVKYYLIYEYMKEYGFLKLFCYSPSTYDFLQLLQSILSLFLQLYMQ